MSPPSPCLGTIASLQVHLMTKQRVYGILTPTSQLDHPSSMKTFCVTSEDTTVYTWDVHAILKEAGLEDLLSIGSNIVTAPEERREQEQTAPQDDDSVIQHTPRSSLSDRSFLEIDATRCPGQFDDIGELPPMFFHGMEAPQSSPMDGAHPHSSANAFLARLFSLLRRFRPVNDETSELPQPSRPLAVHLRALLARLSLLIHHFSPENDAPNDLQRPSTSSRLDPHVLLARLSSLFPRSRLNTDEEAEHRPTMPSSSSPDGRLISWLSSLFHSQPHQRSRTSSHSDSKFTSRWKACQPAFLTLPLLTPHQRRSRTSSHNDFEFTFRCEARQPAVFTLPLSTPHQ
ncbi:uncharacterized protein F5891DRAFT_1283149 [Suillus fuscotomentosus]|uniref:Uncharacterized protein n=1 Tax=Suillus fuscotomentosus TaxID=1912939 RepID=A0AAD4DPN0_9AGAM|nr:uncharacterized protein F5891DRAFT_1283149 [Suillus fuscotomentosus]KAG1888004.1 hypothetical protein F5891DRAFT_1283149 [Suillus fuscotomentosus]